jgi:hypothetical protein
MIVVVPSPVDEVPIRLYLKSKLIIWYFALK